MTNHQQRFENSTLNAHLSGVDSSEDKELEELIAGCPFCDGPGRIEEDGNSFFAECRDCLSWTENSRTKEEAASEWNCGLVEGGEQ